MAYQKLVLNRFQTGLIDENELTKLEYPDGASIDCQNVVWMPSGAMTKRKGFEKLNSTARGNAAITHIQQLRDRAGSDYTVAFSCASGAVSADIALFDTSTAVATFTTIAATGWDADIDDPISTTSFLGSGAWTSWDLGGSFYGWNPSSTVPSAAYAIANAPSGIKVLAGFGNYLFACNSVGESGTEAGIQQHSRVRWSATRNWSSWPSTSYIDLDANDGDEIKAAAVFQNRLIVFKEFKMYGISWVGGSEQFRAQLIDNSAGCVGPNAWIESNSALYFQGTQAAYKYTGMSLPESIGDAVQSQFDEMDIPNSKMAEVESDEEFYQVWFHFATTTSTNAHKDKVLAFDTRFSSWTRFDIEASTIAGIDYGTNTMYIHLPLPYSSYAGTKIRDLAGEKEGLIVIGTYDGFIEKYGNVNNDSDTAIDAFWKSRWLDFGDPTVNKRIYRMTIFVEKEAGDYNLDCDVFTDWDQDTSAASHTVTLTGGAALTVLERPIDFTQPCRSMQVRFGTDVSNSPFTIHKVIIEYLTRGRTKA